jgi:carbamate kinase
VVALGGHAIVPQGAAGTAEEQVATIERAMGGVAALVSEGSDVVVTHGNGPQVGNLLTKNLLARHVVPAMPLHWCVAQTQATIGLAMLTALEARRRRGSDGRSFPCCRGCWFAATTRRGGSPPSRSGAL